MATNAEDIVSKGKVPAEWQDGADEVTSIIKDGFVQLEDAKVNSPLVPAIRLKRDENGIVVLDENEEPIREALVDGGGNPVMDDHPLIHRDKYHGLHAYRYETCDDGSVVALWSNSATGELNMNAFPDLETASLWSPRDERVTSES